MDLETKQIPINNIIVDDDFNCRGQIAPIDVRDLAEDILKNGQLQPCLVMETADSGIYKLVAGFRRFHANKLNKAETVPCVIRANMSEADARVLNLSENLKRKDLNILQEAKALVSLHRAGVPREHVAERLGVSGTWVQTRYALLNLPDDIQKVAANGLLNQQQIKKLAQMPKADQYTAVRMIKERKEKGESADDIITRKKPKPSERRLRTKTEIEDMIQVILKQIGTNPITRALAWAAGGLSDMDLYYHIEAYAADNSLEFDRALALHQNNDAQ